MYPQRERERSKSWLWIILGIVLIGGLGTGIYFFTKNSENKNPDNPNTQYLPNEQEFQQKVDQLKTSKGIDDQQAAIEVLTQYVPYINWWEINSLAELDEKINLVNSKTSFPPFKEVPTVSKFNQETESNFGYKHSLFWASIIPRLSDNSPDWKGIKDWTTYNVTVLKPLIKDRKFKSNFAIQSNYQELGRRLKGEVNSSLSSTCSKFASLNNVSALNQLTNEYLSKIFQGFTYANIHDDFAEQLAISNHQEYQPQKTGNRSENHQWSIALNEFGFKQKELDYSNSTWQDIVDDLGIIENELIRLIQHTESNPVPPSSPYHQKWQDELQSYKLGKQEINSFRTRFPAPITEKQEIVKHRTYFRNKWSWMFRNN